MEKTKNEQLISSYIYVGLGRIVATSKVQGGINKRDFCWNTSSKCQIWLLQKDIVFKNFFSRRI